MKFWEAEQGAQTTKPAAEKTAEHQQNACLVSVDYRIQIANYESAIQYRMVCWKHNSSSVSLGSLQQPRLCQDGQAVTTDARRHLLQYKAYAVMLQPEKAHSGV